MGILCESAHMNLLSDSVISGYDTMKMVRQEAPVMSFCCKDIGIECSFEAHGSTEHELMRKFIDHAEPAHNMQVLSADVIFGVRNAIIKYRI
jgi:predicted small metal-binding protein